ncbi:MAG TPA: CRISPR-associated protein Cas4, partial [Gemmatimonadales bacterium]|nr:CRISPR-associated protein Cas4 [Gemmatimonadales bacterium]
MVTEPTSGTSAASAALPELLPARMVNEFVYCPRLAYLEWVQGEWDDNADTVQGRWAHRRVDVESSGAVPTAEPPEDRSLTARSVTLSSESLGAIARMDLIEIAGRRARPVDYKRGPVPATPERSFEPELIQLCVQGLILRDNGYECDGGVLYYAESKTRVDVSFTAELEARAREALAGLRQMAVGGRMPPPLVDSPKCVRCSLAGICLPDEITRLSHPELGVEPRRLVPGREEALPFYVQEQGASVGKDGDRLVVKLKDEKLREVRLLDVSHLVLFG